MKLTKLSMAALMALAATGAFAEGIEELFTKGKLDGRLRANYFKWDRKGDKADYRSTDYKKFSLDKTTNSDLIDPTGFAVGGSLLYTTGSVYGLSAKVGFYAADDLGVLDSNDARGGKSGKDTFYNERSSGSKTNNPEAMYVLAQAYLQYKYGQTHVRFGRQIVENPLMSANDTKMIPNTFEGLVVEDKTLPQTSIQLGYITKQKLRDHVKFHDLILSGDSDALNDDSGVHKGLKEDKARAQGATLDPKVVVVGLKNSSIPNLKLDLWDWYVADYFNTIMVEANYKITMGEMSLTPGLRYFNQMDKGAGKIGGSYLDGTDSTKADGDADSHLINARLVGKIGAHQLTLGYSKTSGNGDIIAPWRGFPTGGYTRTMTEVNWNTGTTAYALLYKANLEKMGLAKGLTLFLNYAKNDRAEPTGTIENVNGVRVAKPTLDSDSYHTDIVWKVPSVKGLEAKFRYLRHVGKAELDFSDTRFELNYFF